MTDRVHLFVPSRIDIDWVRLRTFGVRGLSHVAPGEAPSCSAELHLTDGSELNMTLPLTAEEQELLERLLASVEARARATIREDTAALTG